MPPLHLILGMQGDRGGQCAMQQPLAWALLFAAGADESEQQSIKADAWQTWVQVTSQDNTSDHIASRQDIVHA